MDIYPYSGGPTTQTILSIRDYSTNTISFVAEYSDTTGKITFYRRDSSDTLTAVATPSLALTKGNFIKLKLSNSCFENRRLESTDY